VFVVEAYDPSPGVIDGADDEQLMSYKHEVRRFPGARGRTGARHTVGDLAGCALYSKREYAHSGVLPFRGAARQAVGADSP
jgi:hypothetical protein